MPIQRVYVQPARTGDQMGGGRWSGGEPSDSRAAQKRGQAELTKIANTSTSPETFQLEKMQFLGIEKAIYHQLTQVSKKMRCLIFIRATNAGVIAGFAEARNVTGKTLVTKGKSTEFLPIKANLAFFSLLAKSNIRELIRVRTSEADTTRAWQTIIKEQDSLIGVVREASPREKLKIGDCQYPTFLYIPKLSNFAALKGRLYLMDIKEPPRWIRLQISDDYRCKITCAGRPNMQLLDATGYPMVFNPLNPPPFPEPTRDFLWVQTGTFDQADSAFQARMKQYWQTIMGPTGGNGDNFAGHLVKDVRDTEPTTPYYQLYISAKSFNYPARSGDTSSSYWQETEPIQSGTSVPIPGQISANQALDAFAPVLAETDLGLNSGPYRAMTVMAQAKQSLDDQKRPAGPLQYFEIMADYDVFCICPSLAQVQERIRRRNDGESVDDSLDYFYPGFKKAKPAGLTGSSSAIVKPTRGMISLFEEKVRKELNAALLGVGGVVDEESVFNPLPWSDSNSATSSTSSSARPPAAAATGTASISGPRFALHGCEVNNYFYTEKFDPVIMVLPLFNETQLPRFHIASETFVQLASGEVVNDPGFDVFTPEGKVTYPPFEVTGSRLGGDYLFLYNLQWGTVAGKATRGLPLFQQMPIADRLDSLLRSMHAQVQTAQSNLRQEAAHLLNLMGNLALADQVHGYISRIAFYAGYYYHIFMTIADSGMHPWDAPAHEACQNIFNAFQCIQVQAQTFRQDLNTVYPTQKGSPFGSRQNQTIISAQAHTSLSNYLKDLLAGEAIVADSFEHERENLTTLLGNIMVSDRPLDAKSIDYILAHWFYHAPYDYLLDNRKFMEEVYSGIQQKRREMEEQLAKPLVQGAVH